MIEIRTWWNAVVAANEIVRAGNTAYLGVAEFSVWISDQPIQKSKCEIRINGVISKKKLKSNMIDYLAGAYLIHDMETVQGILDMIVLIERWEGGKWSGYNKSDQ